MENTIPQNCFYDAETESFVNLAQYMDANGKLVAPAGYSFITAEVNQPQFMHPNAPIASYFPQTPQVQAPVFQQPQRPMRNQYRPRYTSNYGRSGRTPNARKFSISKDEQVQTIYAAVKARMEEEGKLVEIRTEDEGYYTVRMHLKKMHDLVMAPMIIQEVTTRGWVDQISMHYVKKQERIHGISFYMRMNGEEQVQETIRKFAKQKIHSKRVATPPKVETKRLQDTPDEDPDLPEDSDDDAEPKKPEKKTSKCLLVENRKSQEINYKAKNRKHQQRSKSIPVLIPSTKQKSLVLLPNKKQDTMELTFRDGSKKVVKVNNSKRSKSLNPSCLVAVRKGKSFSLEIAKPKKRT